MPKLEQILRTQGYSEEDIQGMATLLADARFRGAIEASIGNYETEATDAKKRADDYEAWYQQQAVPALDKAFKNEQDARAEAAAHREKLKVLQDQGLTRVAEDSGHAPERAAAPPAIEAFDPKKHGLVTWDDVLTFAEQEGEAIALAADLMENHRELFGKRLNLRQLRKEAREAKVPIEQYWERKYNVAARRDELAAKERGDLEAKIRADERAKTIAEVANPMARLPQSSTNPFTRRTGGEDGKAPAPWENAEHRAQERVNKALTKVLQ